MSTTSENRKRTVDSDDGGPGEVSNSKRSAITPDYSLKDRVLNFIAESHIKVHALIMGNVDKELSNISIGIQVMNSVFTAYTSLHQEAQGIQSGLSGKTRVTHEGTKYSKPIDEVVKTVKACAKNNRLEFKNDPTAENWYEMAGSFFNYLTGFGYRLKELRLGHDKMVYKKTSLDKAVVEVSRFGLNRTYHIFLDGISFPPERRCSMVELLGPMTILLSYLKAENEESKTFLDAAKRVFANIPQIENILLYLKGKKYTEIAPIIGIMADISLMIPAMQNTRAFPPPNIFASLCYEELAEDMVVEPSPSTETEEQKEKRLAETLAAMSDKSAMRAKLDFSDFGAFLLYKMACKKNWKMNMKCRSEECAQLIFHAWMGTYKEDLSILSQMTNCETWSKWKSLKDKFQCPNAAGNEKVVQLIALEYYSEMSSASQTAEHQTATMPIFNNERIRRSDLISELTTFRRNLFEKIRSGDYQRVVGCSEWFEEKNLTIQNAKTYKFQAEPCEKIFKARGIYFLG